MGSAFRSASNSASSSLGKITTGILAAVGAYKALGLAKSGLDRAMTLSSEAEQANIAFETMLGSADKAKNFLGDLADFANKTPFELPQVRAASKKLLAFGFDARNIIPMLTGVGNAASGLGLGGEGIDRITLALGQMKAKAKVSGDEMMQLTEAGIPAWDILAKRMGVSTAQVMKLSEKGVIPADKAINALIDGMNERFPKMMEKQSKSMQGMWSTMKDTFDNKILVKFGDGIGDALRPRFEQLTKWIDNNKTTIDRWGANIQRVVGSVSDAIIRKFEMAASFIRNRFINNPEFNKLTTLKAQVDYVFSSLKSAFDDWYSSGGSTEISNATSSLIGYLSDALSASGDKIRSIGADLGKSLASGMLDGLEQFSKENPKMAALLTFISTPGPLAVKAAAAIGVGSGMAGPIVDSAKNVYNGVSSDVSAFKDGFIPGMKNFMDGIKFFDTPDIRDANGNRLGGKALYDYKRQQMYDDKVNGSNAGGLSRVPFNGYNSRLHKDEAVLTKSEADSWRSGSGRGNVTVTGNTFVVRQESDIDAIAKAIAREMNVYGTVMVNG
ncbi:tape measure protein [Paenibacillus sp. SI8]|uniref:tape measure protein n=1 Tax=unclassified Paenibacillus TaxID=185978 RepID=UPI003466F52B